MERIAATLTRPSHRWRGPDHVVERPAPRARAGSQPGVGRDRLGAGERSGTSQPPSAGSPPAPLARTDQSRLSVLVDRGGAGDDLPSTVGKTSTPFVPSLGTGSRICSSRSPRLLEDQELALARVDVERSSPASRGDLVGAEAGAVDERRVHSRALPRHRRRATKPSPSRSTDSTRKPVRSAAPWRTAARRERLGVGHRVGDRLARHLERPVLAQPRLDAVARRRSRPAPTIATSLGGDRGRISPPQRRTGNAERLDHRVAELGRAEDQLGLELAGRTSRSRCGGSPEFVPLAQIRAPPRPRAAPPRRRGGRAQARWRCRLRLHQQLRRPPSYGRSH